MEAASRARPKGGPSEGECDSGPRSSEDALWSRHPDSKPRIRRRYLPPCPAGCCPDLVHGVRVRVVCQARAPEQWVLRAARVPHQHLTTVQSTWSPSRRGEPPTANSPALGTGTHPLPPTTLGRGATSLERVLFPRSPALPCGAPPEAPPPPGCSSLPTRTIPPASPASFPSVHITMVSALRLPASSSLMS